jgi:hypothetical protein
LLNLQPPLYCSGSGLAVPSKSSRSGKFSFGVVCGGNQMLVGRNVTLCGLYLDFGSVRGCVNGLKGLIGIRPTDMSIVVSDGTIISAMQIQTERAGDQRNGIGSPSWRSEYVARVASPANTLAKTLLTMGVPVYDSERLESKIRNGGILVSIRCRDSVIETAKGVLIQTGAQDLSFAREVKAAEPASVRMPEQYAPLVVVGWQQRSAHP